MAWVLVPNLRWLSIAAPFWTVEWQANPCFLSLDFNRTGSRGPPKDWEAGGVYCWTESCRCLSNLLKVFPLYQTKVFPALWENWQHQSLERYTDCLNKVFDPNIFKRNLPISSQKQRNARNTVLGSHCFLHSSCLPTGLKPSGWNSHTPQA